MPQPAPGEQWRHQVPAGFCSDGTSKTLQHRVHVPQDRPGAAAKGTNWGAAAVVISLSVGRASRRDVKHHFAGLAGIQRAKTLVESLKLQMVGDDRRDIETALQHGEHLVPGLVHFATIDSL